MEATSSRAGSGAVGLIMLVLLAGGGCRGEPSRPPPPTPEPPRERPVLAPTYRPSRRAEAGDVFVHLFEWKWTDIAAECETVLGPNGFRAVQVSPPQEHLVLPAAPWWQRYQPVSYGIDRSRSGTRAEFVNMVNRCRAAGVDIYVDAVVNHMTAGSGTGSNGTVYTKYNYPGLYAQGDFHPACPVNNYQSAANVQDCELLGLADLHTGLAPVRQKIADYLVGLARLGVAGFRIDAAKHVQPVELDSILDRANRTLAGEGRPRPYYFAEVIDHGGEAVRAFDYYGLAYGSGGAADITEFRFRGVGDKFLGTGGQRLSQLNPTGPPGSQFSEAAWGLMPGDKAVVFLENHDTQREGGIGYRNGDVYRLASVWMLAQPYGYPSVMSSYAFDRGTQAGRDAGPPSDAGGGTRGVSCAARLEAAILGQWVCEHRDPATLGMVGFRRAVAGSDVSRWWDNGGNAIAFSRGSRGFVAINRESTAVVAAVATGLPAGTYCDVLTGGRRGAACAGAALAVDAAGAVQLRLEPNSAVAVHAGSRL
ncbi:MAG TPA: alpha-amylase family protein [Longimicrobiaceae bacterium]|nr:alpha-amylase family protein [Longimicrobiaceae bacterium]